MSHANKSLFRAVWAAVKAGGLAIMLGLVVLVVNHTEMAPQDSSRIGAAGPAVVADTHQPAEAVYLPTRR